MSAETALQALLLADAAVAALVSTRIAADRMEQGADMPFVVYARTGTEPVAAISGQLLKSLVAIDVQCWADTRLAADNLADAVASAVRGVTSQRVLGRQGVYDPDLDAHATVLAVSWWE